MKTNMIQETAEKLMQEVEKIIVGKTEQIEYILMSILADGHVLLDDLPGSGKTTLTRILTERYNAKAYLEECNNPYIGDFYEDMNRWSFNLQIYFLGSRIQQTMDMLDRKSVV